jgi:hypothetical protein
MDVEFIVEAFVEPTSQPAPPAVCLPTPPHVAALERLGDEIAELSAHVDAATYRLLVLIREFDERGGWGNGFRSCAEWLSWRVGLDPGAARERVRVARALAGFPKLAAAMARGELSYSKVRALTRVATPETEDRLLTVGRSGTADHVDRIVRAWRRVDRRIEAKEANRQHAARGLQLLEDIDGMVVIRGRLTPEVGALLRRALEAGREAVYQRERQVAVAAEQLARDAWGAVRDAGPQPAPAPPIGERPTQSQLNADALALLAEAALHGELDPGAPGERYQVVVHVDAPVLADPAQPGQCELEDGGRVPAGTSQRLACDATRVVMVHDPEGRVVEVGARTRTIPPAMRRALHYRDRTCRFPGCATRPREGHHVQHWAEGGPTTLSNLALLCRRHHRAVHEEGYTVERQVGDGERLVFRRPDGREIPHVPTPVTVPADSVDALRAEHVTQGVHIDARTSRSSWLGEHIDLGWAIGVLHPAANPPRKTA